MLCKKIISVEFDFTLPQKTSHSPYIIANRNPLAAIDKFSNATGKLMIGKTLAINGKEITNAMIGNTVLAIYW